LGESRIIKEAKPKKNEVSKGKGKANATPISDQDEPEQEPPATIVRKSSFLDKIEFRGPVPIATYTFKYYSKGECQTGIFLLQKHVNFRS